MKNLLIFCGTLAIVAWVTIATSNGATVTGTVYDDTNSSGTYNTGEELSGILLQLYEDDGDGVFGTGDVQLGSRFSTGADGVYTFANLDPVRAYFVMQPGQTIGNQSYTSNVGSLLSPSAPLIMIDEFSSRQTVMVTALSTASASVARSTADLIGGERDFYLHHDYGSAESSLRANPYGLNSVLEFDQSAGVSSVATITWDGVDGVADTGVAMGLGGIDLTNGGLNTGIELKMGIDAAGDGDTFKLRLYQGSSDRYSEALAAVPLTNGTATTSIVIPFSAFVGPVTASDVDAIQLELGGQQPSIDMQLDYIGVIGPIISNMGVLSEVIPEPSALKLMAIWAVLGIIGFRRDSWLSRQTE